MKLRIPDILMPYIDEISERQPTQTFEELKKEFGERQSKLKDNAKFNNSSDLNQLIKSQNFLWKLFLLVDATKKWSDKDKVKAIIRVFKDISTGVCFKVPSFIKLALSNGQLFLSDVEIDTLIQMNKKIIDRALLH